jgi:hypothetical protein
MSASVGCILPFSCHRHVRQRLSSGPDAASIFDFGEFRHAGAAPFAVRKNRFDKQPVTNGRNRTTKYRPEPDETPAPDGTAQMIGPNPAGP